MKNFIFFTKDGYTYDLDNKEIENLQILGTAEGIDILEAFKQFKISHSYLKRFNFKEVIALEYIDVFITNLEL